MKFGNSKLITPYVEGEKFDVREHILSYFADQDEKTRKRLEDGEITPEKCERKLRRNRLECAIALTRVKSRPMPKPKGRQSRHLHDRKEQILQMVSDKTRTRLLEQESKEAEDPPDTGVSPVSEGSEDKE